MKDIGYEIYGEILPHILKAIAVPLVIVTMLYGLVATPQKASEFYFGTIKFLVTPYFDHQLEGLRDLPNKIQNITNQQH